jgi:hypothetical protein
MELEMTAFAVAMVAVMISLAVVFFSRRSSKSQAVRKREDGDSGTNFMATDSAVDCSPGDGGACDGGGGD